MQVRISKLSMIASMQHIPVVDLMLNSSTGFVYLREYTKHTSLTMFS